METGDFATFEAFLTWIISRGGAAAAGFYLIEHVAWFAKLQAWPKRVIALAVTALIAWGAWAVMIVFTGQAWPVNWQAWIDTLWSIGVTAGIGSTLVHGAVVLRQQKV